MLLTVAQHARAAAGQADPERVHLGQDARAARADRRSASPSAATRSRRGELRATSGRRERGATIEPGPSRVLPALSAASGALGLLVALCVAQVGSLFSADAWNNVTFTAGEVQEPAAQRSRSRSPSARVLRRSALYLLANVAYLCVLPLDEHPDTRRTIAWRPPRCEAIFGDAGAAIMAVAIMISTFGCNNGLILAGARVYYAMARDGLFFALDRPAERAARARRRRSLLQGVWASLLVLPRTRARCDRRATGRGARTATSTAICSTTSSSRCWCSTC